jgi:hypothetical protein
LGRGKDDEGFIEQQTFLDIRVPTRLVILVAVSSVSVILVMVFPKVVGAGTRDFLTAAGTCHPRV